MRKLPRASASFSAADPPGLDDERRAYESVGVREVERERTVGGQAESRANTASSPATSKAGARSGADC